MTGRPELILHIGTHKTGTASIQTVCGENRDLLAAEGLIYPDGLGVIAARQPHHAWSHLVTKAPGRDIRLAKRYVTRLKESLKPGERVLLSAEPLYRHIDGFDGYDVYKREDYWLRREKYLTRVRNILSDFDVRVVVWFREKDEFARLMFDEFAKRDFCGRSYEAFLDEFAVWFDYERQLENLRQTFASVNWSSYHDKLAGGPVPAFFRGIDSSIPAKISATRSRNGSADASPGAVPVAAPSVSTGPTSEFFVSKSRLSPEIRSLLCLGFLPDLEKAARRCGEFADNADLAAMRRTASVPDVIGALFERAMNEALGPLGRRPIGLGVSSGLDSRLLLHGLAARHEDFTLYCFGSRGMLDFDFQQASAVSSPRSIIFFDTDRAPFTKDMFLQAARTLTAMQPSPRVLTIAAMRERGEIELHGYLNDLLTGANIEGPRLDWEGAREVYRRRADCFGFQQYFKDGGREFLPRRPWAGDEAISYFDQLDLFHRYDQRFRLAEGAGRGERLFPYETWSWMAFWLTRSEEERKDQRLFIAFLKTLGSAVFYDLDQSAASGRAGLIAWQKALLYRDPRDGSTSRSGALRNATGHFCAQTCYVRNPSFRELADELLASLRTRRIVRASYIDSLMKKVTRGRGREDKALKGLLTLELAIEVGKVAP